MRRRSRRDPERLKRGPAGVLHAIVDRIVDDYDPVLRGVEDDIEEVEETAFSQTARTPPQRIYHLKGEVLELHRATGPLVGPLDQLSTDQHDYIPEEMHSTSATCTTTRPRRTSTVEDFREMLNSVLGAT